MDSLPRFSVGRELATLVTSCGILDRAWGEIRNISKNENKEFSRKEDEGVAYVTFPSFSTQDFIVTNSGSYGECNILEEESFSVCLKGSDDRPAIVHERALSRFNRILRSSDFRTKILENLKAQAVIFVGHSMGGAVATLITLWFLQKEPRNRSYFCITFGSPLVGNDVLGEAIRREDWTGNFCHVVSKYDIVPRVPLAPLNSIVELLKEQLVPHWRTIMVTDSVAVTNPSIPILFKKVAPYTAEVRSPYRPFGIYMFCSTQGAACIEDSEAVLKMLHFTLQGVPFDQLAGTCESDHTGYGQMLEAVTEALLNTTPIANFAADSFEMGIELEAMAVGSQNPDATSALKAAGVKKNEQDTNIKKLIEKLSEMQNYMAEVEGYKARCQQGSGYYDSFQVGTDVEMPEYHVNLARENLAAFWDNIVKMEEKHVLPSDLRRQNKWINAGTAYRRLIEPLDIKYHHLTRVDNKSYRSVGVRHPRYIVLEKWLTQKDQTRLDRNENERTKFASLTLDSCFWARFDEARQAFESIRLQGHEDVIAPLKTCRGFEDHIWKMIGEKSISEEVFLKNSSFMNWWEEYRPYLESKFPEFMSEDPTDGIHNFIENEGWK